MISMKMEFGRSFFDPNLITDPLERAEVKALKKVGAFIRTNASRSIRRRKNPSPPGRPPHAHAPGRHANLKDIRFDVEKTNGRWNAVVGPVLLNTSAVRALGVSVPEVLEKGGLSFVIERRRLTNRRGDILRERKIRRVRIQARPFMQPAMDEEAPKLSGFIRDFWDQEAIRAGRASGRSLGRGARTIGRLVA